MTIGNIVRIFRSAIVIASAFREAISYTDGNAR
jgi:hypothetical protein